MSEHTPAELAAMRKRWARRRAATLAKPAPKIMPDELHRLAIEESRRVVAARLATAEALHREAAQADAAGERNIARTLHMLAHGQESAAALEVAARGERERGFTRWQRTQRNREQARRPRPGRRSALRDAIVRALAPLKREGIAFRDAMRRWRAERVGTLRLADLGGGRFRVTDEDSEAIDTATYTRGTLERLYSESQRVLTDSTG